MGDRLTSGKTPLEAASTPWMDKIAKEGINGIMDSVRTGTRPGSDTAHLSLFGYNPFKVYTGRGPLEAAGAGLTLKTGDVGIRCNFASVKDKKIVDRRAGREEYGLQELANDIDGIEIDGVKTIFKKCPGHRGALVLRGTNLSSEVTDSDPEEINVGIRKSVPLDDSEEAKFTSGIINKFTKITTEILEDHRINEEREKLGKLPANAILMRGSGIKPEIERFEMRHGVKGACISATDLIKGICRLVGMDVIDVEGTTGHVDSNIKGKALATIDALKSYEFVFLHIKGTDEASHDGDFEAKKMMIERIDKEVIRPILENIENTNVVLTADHSTPVSVREHTADPVPIAIYGDVRTDLVDKYTERDCARGDLNRICGRYLMDILFDLSNKAKLFGA